MTDRPSSGFFSRFFLPSMHFGSQHGAGPVLTPPFPVLETVASLVNKLRASVLVACEKAAQGNRSSLGAHSNAVLTTARAAAPKATVRPMTASRTKRRVVDGWATATAGLTAELSRAACFCLRLRRRTESGRC